MKACVSFYGLGAQNKEKMAIFFVSNTIGTVWGRESERLGVNASPLLGSLDEKVLNLTILSFLINKMEMVVIAPS